MVGAHGTRYTVQTRKYNLTPRKMRQNQRTSFVFSDLGTHLFIGKPFLRYPPQQTRTLNHTTYTNNYLSLLSPYNSRILIAVPPDLPLSWMDIDTLSNASTDTLPTVPIQTIQPFLHTNHSVMLCNIRSMLVRHLVPDHQLNQWMHVPYLCDLSSSL